MIISKDGDDLFSAILGGSTGILYQVQYANLNSRSAYISACNFSMHLLSRLKKVDLTYFTFFHFSFDLFFYSLFLEQLGLGLICHTVTSVTT